MIEVTIKNYLTEALPVPVYMQRPEQIPEQYVLMQKTGSAKANRVSTATIAFQSCATRLADAMTLNEAVKEAVESMVALNEVGAVRLNSDYNFTDTQSKQYRYQAVYVITHY